MDTNDLNKWAWLAFHLGAAAPSLEEWRNLCVEDRRTISNALYDLIRDKPAEIAGVTGHRPGCRCGKLGECTCGPACECSRWTRWTMEPPARDQTEQIVAVRKERDAARIEVGRLGQEPDRVMAERERAIQEHQHASKVLGDTQRQLDDVTARCSNQKLTIRQLRDANEDLISRLNAQAATIARLLQNTDERTLATQVVQKQRDEAQAALDKVTEACTGQVMTITQLRKENEELRSRPCSHRNRGFDSEFRKLRAVLDKAGIGTHLGTLSDQVEVLIDRQHDEIRKIRVELNKLLGYKDCGVTTCIEQLRNRLAQSASAGDTSTLDAMETTDAEIWDLVHPDKFIAKAIKIGLTSQEDGDTPEERAALASRQVYDRRFLADFWMNRLLNAAREANANQEPSANTIAQANLLRIAIRYARAAGLDAKLA